MSPNEACYSLHPGAADSTCALLGYSLPPGAADLISQLTSEEECEAIISAFEDTYLKLPVRNGKVEPSFPELPEGLMELQTQLDLLRQEYLRDTRKLEIEYQEKLNPLFRERYEIVSAATTKETPLGIAEPHFWLTALMADKYVKKLITEQDMVMLQYLRDIRCDRRIDPTDTKRWSCKLEFVFDPCNPYFTNPVLTKVFEFSFQNYGTVVDKAQGTPIYWTPCKCSLEHYGWMCNWASSKYSFFNFFETEDVPKEEDGMDAVEEYRKKIEQQYVLCGKRIMQGVVPYATALCRYPGLKPKTTD